MKHSIFSILSMLLFSVSANATIITDQNQDSATVYMAGFGQADLAQSFQQSADNIAGAGIFLQANIGSTDMVTISLWDALPNGPANMLASASAIGTQGSWVDVFWDPVAILADTTYYLVFTSANRTLGIAGSTSNPYDRGQVYANAGFGSFVDFDYTFRTYADDSFSVPEPGTLLLFVLGVASIRLVNRKKSV